MKRLTTALWKRPDESQKIKVENGKPFPLGAHFTEEGIRFSVYSRNAQSISLLLMKPKDIKPYFEIHLNEKHNKTGDIWHVQVNGLKDDVLYGYRVFSEGGKSQNTILLDPYAQYISGCNSWGQKSETRFSGLIRHELKRSIPQPEIPLSETIIYEMHVRGFTRHHSSRSKYPGTYRAIIEKIPYLKSLGITSVELLPVFEFDENDNSFHNAKTGEKLKNFWGYNSISFFSPKTSYASERAKNYIAEFKDMIRSFHRSGIEVILDVVFNHTGEGDQKGKTIHFKNFGKDVYYMLDQNQQFLNFSGCGNTVNCNHPVVADWIIDCLRFWAGQIGIDGFRFDLAAIFSRGSRGEVLSESAVIDRITKDPILSKKKLIAEAWDAGGLYQVGHFPSSWLEWNDRFRDDVRSFLRGDSGKCHAAALRLLGSPDIFEHAGRSLNFITCHDGFTLWDTVSYNYKHNEINGENNRDGTDNNNSWNCGEEGESQDFEIIKLRHRQVRNMLTFLFVSQGIPMLLAGDEMGRTQKGNNNAYCQDNEISWLDWRLKKKNKDLWRFVRELIAFRKRHKTLSKMNFLAGPDLIGKDIQWHGVVPHEPDWSYDSHSLVFLLPDTHTDIYVAFNAYWQPLIFKIPPASDQKKWHILIDTAKPYPEDIVPENKKKRVLRETHYKLQPRSSIVLVSIS